MLKAAIFFVSQRLNTELNMLFPPLVKGNFLIYRKGKSVRKSSCIYAPVFHSFAFFNLFAYFYVLITSTI